MPLVSARRLLAQPIIHQGLHPSLGTNINGPSVIETPGWLRNRRARFYLYFAHHTGRHIRLAMADHLAGPWRIHAPGALHLRDTPFAQTAPDLPQPDWARAMGVDGLYPHIASPEVQPDPARRRLNMWLHGLDADGEQRTVRATSDDGLTWQVAPQRIHQAYLRIFDHAGQRYAMAHGGQILRETPDAGFAHGPRPFPPGHRHAAVFVRDTTLHVLWTRIGDTPERIWYSTIDLTPPWQDWRLTGPTIEVMRPTQGWEGVHRPLAPSRIGTAAPLEHALRDPALIRADGRLYMIYAGGGEAALGLAELNGL